MKSTAFIPLFALIISAGCTSVKYNGGETFVKKVDYPEVGKVVTASVGDNMVQKGSLVEETVLIVNKPINGALYHVPSKEYSQVGYDNYDQFFTATGVTRSGLADPVKAIAVKKNQNRTLRVISIYGGNYSCNGDFRIKKKLSMREDSFQQTLI